LRPWRGSRNGITPAADPFCQAVGERGWLEAPTGFEPVNRGFADLCLTPWLRRQASGTYHARGARVNAPRHARARRAGPGGRAPGGKLGAMGHRAPARVAPRRQPTAYSLLDGAARIKDLVEWVKEVPPDRPAVAMTDHGNMHGAVEFYKTATAAGVKPIIGFEAYVAPGSRFEKRRGSSKIDGGYFHLTLLAKDFEGYKNLCKLSSRAYLEGFYMKPRIDLELLEEHHQGVIALSGCLGAQIPRTILDLGEEEGERVLNRYLSIFGDDFFIELQDHGLEEQRRLNRVLKELAQRYGIGMVATNDGHYVRKEDAHAHDVLLAIGTKALVSDENRMRFPCDEFYVRSEEH